MKDERKITKSHTIFENSQKIISSLNSFNKNRNTPVIFNENVYFNNNNNNNSNNIYNNNNNNNSSSNNINKRYDNDLEGDLTEHTNISRNRDFKNNLNRNSHSVPVNLKVNINNNYYNSNIKIIEGGSSGDRKEGFFSKMVKYIFGNKKDIDSNKNNNKNDNNDYGEDDDNIINLSPTHTNVYIATETSVQPELPRDYSTSPSNIIMNTNSDNNFSIPCTNCNNLIHPDDIDSHSNFCTYVKDEIYKLERNPSSFNNVDYKLKKLLENIRNIKNLKNSQNTNSIIKDLHSITSLDEYITSAFKLCYLNHQTMVSFKNVISNIDILVVAHKGHISTLILLERAKVLILEKFRLIKEEIRKKKETEQMNSRKSGYLNKISHKGVINEIKKEIEDEIKKKNSVENERDNIKRKVQAFRNMSNSNNGATFNVNDNNDKNDNNEINAKENEIEDANEDDESINFTDINQLKFNSINTNVIDDINSDYDDVKSRKSLTSEYTMTNQSTNSINIYKDDIGYLTERERDNITSLTMNDLSGKIFSPVHSTQTLIFNPKPSYREFASIVLKVKFEKLNNSHLGQKIEVKLLWDELKRQEIPYKKWSEFTLDEMMNQTDKYEDLVKAKRNYRAMDTIQEDHYN